MPQRHASFPTHCRRLIREDSRKTRAARSLRAAPFGPLGTLLPSSLPGCSSLRKPRFRLLRAYHHPFAILILLFYRIGMKFLTREQNILLAIHSLFARVCIPAKPVFDSAESFSSLLVICVIKELPQKRQLFMNICII